MIISNTTQTVIFCFISTTVIDNIMIFLVKIDAVLIISNFIIILTIIMIVLLWFGDRWASHLKKYFVIEQTPRIERAGMLFMLQNGFSSFHY